MKRQREDATSERRTSNETLITGPCYRPHQHNDDNKDSSTSSGTVKLDFNYWINNGCISSSDISNLISSVLTGRGLSNIPYLDTSSSTDTPTNIYVFALYGLDASVIASNLHQLPFLSSCTSMPVRHTLSPSSTPTFNDESAHTKMWRFSSVEYMSSSILWPERKSLQLKQYEGIPIVELFRTKSLLFRGTHQSWNDTLLFGSSYADDIVNAYNSLVTKHLTLNPSNSSLNLQYESSSNSCIGKFQRQGHSDADSATYSLVLGWYRWDLEILTLNTEANTIKFPLEFSLSKSLFSLTIDAVYNNKYTNEAHVVTSTDNAAASTDSGIDRGFDGFRDFKLTPLTSVTRDEQLANINQLHQSSKLPLSSLCLSSEMQAMLGYRVDAEKEMFVYNEAGKCIKQNDDYLTTVSASIKHSMECVMEEGEEVDDAPVDTASGNSAYLDVCAIDCEMCMTAAGLELTRVSIVSLDGVVYDSMVKPHLPITEYNTAFSGINEEIMLHVTTSLQDVHRFLQQRISSDTIIIGHGLENDLKALKLNHNRLIDTAALFPHAKGLPLKNSLKKLSEDFLNRMIREVESDGHNSIEDALLALELTLLFAVEGSSKQIWKYPCAYAETQRESLFDEMVHSKIAASASLYGCSLYSSKPDWEQFSLGYRPEADICNSTIYSALDNGGSGALSVKCISYADCYAAFEDAVKGMKATVVTDVPGLTWVDMPCGSTVTNSKLQDEVAVGWMSLDTVDSCLFEAYQLLPANSVFLVLTQGDVMQCKRIMAKKQLNKWDPSRFAYEDADEAALILAAARCLSGAAFIRKK